MASRTLLGKGRSAKVFLEESPEGNRAVKAFYDGGILAKAANYLLQGAPNPYMWDEDAVWTSFYRRKVLSDLVEFWFENRLKAANSISIGWNGESRAFELTTEFVDGRTASLHSPFSHGREHELGDLVNSIMCPLQKNLADSGFDGLAWQAGKGNPAAIGNFLLESNTGKWAWIDLESGIPAFVPISLDFFTYYLPKAMNEGKFLFDDVDVGRLREYATRNVDGLMEKIGSERYIKLIRNINNLEDTQKKWKSKRRAHRSIECHLKKGNISSGDATWYRKHVLAWYAREAVRLTEKSIEKGLEAALGTVNYIFSRDFIDSIGKNVKHLSLLIGLPSYRTEYALNFFKGRVNNWAARKQISQEEAHELLESLKNDSISSYLADFGLLMSLKPIIKTSQAIALPALYNSDYANAIGVSIAIFAGSIIRAAYVTGRMAYSIAAGKEKPWAAFLIGILPIAGNYGYPIQIMQSGMKQNGKAGQFIAYDIPTIIGGKVPIVGGHDSKLEHFLNNLPTRAASLWNRKIVPAAYFLGRFSYSLSK